MNGWAMHGKIRLATPEDLERFQEGVFVLVVTTPDCIAEDLQCTVSLNGENIELTLACPGNSVTMKFRIQITVKLLNSNHITCKFYKSSGSGSIPSSVRCFKTAGETNLESHYNVLLTWFNNEHVRISQTDLESQMEAEQRWDLELIPGCCLGVEKLLLLLGGIALVRPNRKNVNSYAIQAGFLTVSWYGCLFYCFSVLWGDKARPALYWAVLTPTMILGLIILVKIALAHSDRDHALVHFMLNVFAVIALVYSHLLWMLLAKISPH